MPEHKIQDERRDRPSQWVGPIRVLAITAFLLPALFWSVTVTRKAQEAAPFVAELRAEADAAGLEVTPDSYHRIFAPADYVPPDAVEQVALVQKGFAQFNGDPVDAGLLEPIVVVILAVASTIWALGALAVPSFLGRSKSITRVLTIGAIAAVWLPVLYYRDLIDVVGFYVG